VGNCGEKPDILLTACQKDCGSIAQLTDRAHNNSRRPRLYRWDDAAFSAFDIERGKELWESKLPASGVATPMTFQTKAGGRQIVVIAAGGYSHVSEEPQSDALVAFALPPSTPRIYPRFLKLDNSRGLEL